MASTEVSRKGRRAEAV